MKISSSSRRETQEPRGSLHRSYRPRHLWPSSLALALTSTSPEHACALHCIIPPTLSTRLPASSLYLTMRLAHCHLPCTYPEQSSQWREIGFFPRRHATSTCGLQSNRHASRQSSRALGSVRWPDSIPILLALLPLALLLRALLPLALLTQCCHVDRALLPQTSPRRVGVPSSSTWRSAS